MPLIVPKPDSLPPLRINQRIDGVWADERGNYVIRDFTAEEEAEYEMINNLTLAASTHRLGAPSTIAKEDRVLQEFKRDMIFRYRMMGRKLSIIDTNDPKFDEILFNEDPETLLHDIIFYIQMWMKKAVPRKLTDTRPKLSGATQRRTHLEKWILEKRKEPLFTRRFNREITKGIHLAAKTLWKGRIWGAENCTKVFFGRYELKQLLDWESFNSISRELSEQHELAWCLGCCCGIRPCSLGELSTRKGQFLRWRDIVITRAFKTLDGRRRAFVPWLYHGFCTIKANSILELERADDETRISYAGKFNMVITFPFLKTNREEDASTGAEHPVLRMTVDHIQNPENIALSPALRALGIMMRRGIIDIESIDQLLYPPAEKEFLTIAIRPEFLDSPVFIAGLPGGRGLDPSGRPASTDGISAFFKRRAIAAGYPESVTMYAWRRGFATVLDQTVERSTVRALLAHRPDSVTFEDHYDDPTINVDVSAIVHGEKQRRIQDSSHPVLYRIQYSWTPAEEKNFLQAIVAQDRAYQLAENSAEKKRAAKNARYRGRLSMREQQRTEKTAITLTEYQERVKDLRKNSALYTELLTRARDITITEDIEDEDIDMNVEDTYNDVGDALGLAFPDEENELCEDGHGSTTVVPGNVRRTSNSEGIISATVSIDESPKEKVSGITYSLTVKVFLEWLLDTEAPTITAQVGSRTERGSTCRLCETDPTTSEEEKGKLWASQSKLSKHQTGLFHSGNWQWIRTIKAIYPPEGKKVKCNYEECPKKDFVYADHHALKLHIIAAARSSINDTHARAIRRDGWLEPDFFGDEPDSKKRKSDMENKPVKKSHKKKADIGVLRPEAESGYTVLKDPRVLETKNGVPVLFGGPIEIPKLTTDSQMGHIPRALLNAPKVDHDAWSASQARNPLMQRGPNDHELGHWFKKQE
ncbi:uncharacterized protein EAE98_008459 [Botrytis deweyae]|uniref:Tyr recombinase domain-containing protein n=1 Tax=Botrytis deweyae TaxID=2478750 RepID=A0ABQ7IE93_9HELO|nr:uncharacterized protein EAE98_008459 [Botrytis deweyae]KAF7921612.1 hypothetical protein EAE98_008459 [Botrytis deweyae]